MTSEGRGDRRPEGEAEVIEPHGEAAFIRGEGAVQDAHAERSDGAATDTLQDAEEDQRMDIPGKST